MRVLHIQKAKGIGGSERHLLTLLPALTRSGIQTRMCVLTSGDWHRFIGPFRDAGVDVVTMGAGPDLNPALITRLALEIRRFRPHLVHTHLIHADTHGQLAAALAGAPGLISLHSAHAFYSREPFRSAARLAGRLARRTIAISDHVGRFCQQERLSPRDRMQVVHYGIDVEEWVTRSAYRDAQRTRFGLAPGDFAVGMASRLIPGKGHSLVIDALAQGSFDFQRPKLLIAGDGPLRRQLEERARDSLPVGFWSFVGYQSDMRAFLVACDVLVLPTLPQLSEGFGLAALEAMATGRPVIVTQVGSLPEMVIDGRTGYIVPPGSLADLSDRIERLCADRRLRLELGSAARERARNRFSSDEMVKKVLSIYEEVVAG